MKKLLNKLGETLADAALLEMGVAVAAPGTSGRRFTESLEENLVEIAFAEAADYDDIHKAILQDHRKNERVHLDECGYGDNDACFAH
jgi:hypothetical protein